MSAKFTTNARFDFDLLPQPNDTTCGPTCLHSVYRYWGDDLPLGAVIDDIAPLPGGGTIAVALACHALRRGYQVEIITWNLQIFDPTWFQPGVDIAQKLREQKKRKRSARIAYATEMYLEFLELGGTLLYRELTASLLRDFFRRGVPVLTGVSATYLYNCARERNDDYDDVAGEPMGHFVVLSGYDRKSRRVRVADPLADNPAFGRQHYWVEFKRLIASILLGILTYDANVLIVTPKDQEEDNNSGNTSAKRKKLRVPRRLSSFP